MIHIYYGNGKGKSTAAAGLALRALGHGFSVLMFKFLKNRGGSGEDRFLEKFRKAKIVYAAAPVPLFLSGRDAKAREKARVSQVRLFGRILPYLEKKYRVVVLDEVLDLVRPGWIGVRDLIRLVQKVPSGTELVLTGHYADPLLLRSADLVTEMKKVKHYYDKGRAARKGIEF